MQIRLWKAEAGLFNVLVKPTRRSGVASVLTRGASLAEVAAVVLEAGTLEQNSHAAIREIKRAAKRP